MPPEKITKTMQDQFREELSKVTELVNALSPVCHSLEELVGVCELAQTNDAQLRMVMKTCTENAQQKR